MNEVLFVIVCGIIVMLATLAMVRISLKKKVKELDGIIDKISPYSHTQSNRSIGEADGYLVFDIYADLKSSFANEFISASREKEFTDQYEPYYRKASSLIRKLEILRIAPTEKVEQFVRDFNSISSNVKKHNNEIVSNLLTSNKDFFDHCLKYPLDYQQRRSIVSEEENCLVISSAGSGKTSSIIGKVKYLIDIKKVNPERILLISYTNKAAAELTERIQIDGLRGYTFHKLALDIIGRTTGVKPSICDNTDALFVNIYHDLLGNKKFKDDIVEYFIDYQLSESESDKLRNDRREQLSEQKRTQIKSPYPDMDGKAVYVRSDQELKICIALSNLGVRFRYEEPYEHLLADETHSQYKPDFSIYYECNGETKRIYLEHFGVDEHSLVPVWFANDRNMTYEEANQNYNDGITWKKAAHEKYGTKLITTSSADFHYSDIKEKIKVELIKLGASIHEKTESDLYDSIIQKDSKQEKSFIRLVATFITLLKSSCKSLNDTLHDAHRADDERSESIIRKIFKPVYENYIRELKVRGQIDFTDAIIQATKLCQSYRCTHYDYIIVDEFQDISVDRYEFLKVLREGNPPAKLYCVGDDWQSIYRFSGSDMSLFSQFADYFGATEINKIETTYRFGEPLVGMSAHFIQRNECQIKKNIHPFNTQVSTELVFQQYEQIHYCDTIGRIVAQLPPDKSIFLLGRYSFDDYYLAYRYQSIRRGNKFFYIIGGREIEFMTVHKSKGLEADYVIILQCNKDTYGFPSLVSDNPALDYVLTKSDQFPYGEERRLFYVAITRAKIKTIVLYDASNPSVFVDEFLNPDKVTEDSYAKHPNSGKPWTKAADRFLLALHREGKSVKEIAAKMGRSQTAVIMRLGYLSSRRPRR